MFPRFFGRLDISTGATARLACLCLGVMYLAACAETQFVAATVKRVSQKPEQQTTYDAYKIGKPYQIKGIWYYPKEDFGYDETGIASWYGPKFHGRKTANGEIYDMNEVSAAHRTLPLPSIVSVTNLDNGRTLKLRINDRGPYAHGRIIDLSRRAAQLLGFQRQGTAKVRVRILADDSRMLAARLKGEAEFAEIGSPITVDSLPKPKVSAENLPPPGATTAAEPVTQTPPRIPAMTPETPQLAVLSEPEAVSVVPVSETRIYIQAGAFSNFDNANRVRARLHLVGPTKISPVLIDGRDLFRVRLGPLNSVAEADQLLESVFQAGYTDARTIVD